MKWTVYSEEKPQKVGSYLVTHTTVSGSNYVDYDYWTVTDNFKYHPTDVVAWMPFPKPYEAEQTEPSDNSCKTCRYGEVDEGYVLCKYYSKAEQTEPNSSEKPNNCEPKPCEWCKFYDGENCFSQEPCKVMLYFKTEPQPNADQHVQHVESVEPTWTKEEHEAFYTFLWNVINPNEMQDYIGMFEAKDEPQTDCPTSCPSKDICTKDIADCAWK